MKIENQRLIIMHACDHRSGHRFVGTGTGVAVSVPNLQMLKLRIDEFNMSVGHGDQHTSNNGRAGT